MFRKMPFIMVIIIVAITTLFPLIPLEVKQGLYAVSLTIKALIVLLLPLVIFSLLFRAAIKATRVIGVVLLLVCVANFISTFLSHYVGIWVYNFDLSMLLPSESQSLKSLWGFEFPQLIANDKAMFTGIILGIIASKLNPKLATRVSDRLGSLVEKLLKCFVYIIPFFVAGFIVKLQSEGMIWLIIKDYTAIFAFIALAQFAYIFLAYFLTSGCSLKQSMVSIKNMFPAGICGFSTMSSAASMPLTIIGVESNAKNKDIARSVIPVTVNIHLVGDCFAIPIFAYAILKSFGMPEPSLLSYLIFTFYFVIAKFSVAAIPGGGIIVMLPILETYMGFNAEMMSLITALYILFDPVITSANVLGNGAFAKMIDLVMYRRKVESKKDNKVILTSSTPG